MLTNEQINDAWSASINADPTGAQQRFAFARAIESAATAPLLERIAELERDVHNLNWALGTEGFDQMATPEDQAAHEAGHAAVLENIARMKARKERHDQLVPDGVDYLDRIAELEQEVQRFQSDAVNEKAARQDLERQLEQAREQMESQKDEWLSWESKRKALERDATRWKTIAHIEARIVAADILVDYIARPERLDFIASVQPERAAIQAEVKP